MVICLDRGANSLHMIQLIPLPPHHLLLHYNLEWFTFWRQFTQVGGGSGGGGGGSRSGSGGSSKLLQLNQ